MEPKNLHQRLKSTYQDKLNYECNVEYCYFPQHSNPTPDELRRSLFKKHFWVDLTMGEAYNLCSICGKSITQLPELFDDLKNDLKEEKVRRIQ